MTDNTLLKTCQALYQDYLQTQPLECQGEQMTEKPCKINSNPEPQSLDELAREIAERGNDMQTTHSKDGLKVFEVSKKLVKVIPN